MIGAPAHCQAFGLRIRSEIAIPGAMVLADTGQADIEIGYGAIAPWQARSVEGPYRVASADLFDFTMPDLARFTCLDRRRIVVEPVPHADAEQLSSMLIATALPALLWSRGEIMLHAAAALLPGTSRALAVVGDSRSGKSTLLSRALALGACAIADDSICIRLSGDGATISGLPGGFFSWEHDARRSFHAVPEPCQRASAPLGGLLFLEPAASDIRRLTGGEAVEALLRHRHRPRIARLLGIEPRTLPGLASVAESVPIAQIATITD